MNRNHIYRTYWIVAVSGLFIIGVASVFILARSNWPGYGEVIATAELEALGGYVDQMEIWHHDLPGWVHYTSEAGRKIDEFVPQCISIHSRSWLPAKLADQVGIRHPKHVLRGTVHGTASLRHLGNLKFVRYVDFEDSDTDDETMKALGRMPDLIGINLSKTRVSDRGITHLGSLRHLEDLNLSGTLIGDDALCLMGARIPLDRNSANFNGLFGKRTLVEKRS